MTFASDLLAAVSDASNQHDQTTGSNKERVLVVLNSATHIYTSAEISALDKFNAQGGAILVFHREDEDQLLQTNINSLLAPWSIRFDRNRIIRPNPYELYHPQEAVLVDDCIVNRGLMDAFERHANKKSATSVDLQDTSAHIGAILDSLKIVYANGCSLRGNRDSVVMMTSSSWAIPNQQPICLFFQPKSAEQGRLVAMGSSDLINNHYIDRESNKTLIKAILEYLERDKLFSINVGDARTVEIPDLTYAPDINLLLRTPIGCLQGSQIIPKDPRQMVEKRLFNIDSRNLPTVIQAYQDLGVPKEALTLIKPKFERKFLDLQPAVHGFRLAKITLDN